MALATAMTPLGIVPGISGAMLGTLFNRSHALAARRDLGPIAPLHGGSALKILEDVLRARHPARNALATPAYGTYPSAGTSFEKAAWDADAVFKFAHKALGLPGRIEKLTRPLEHHARLAKTHPGFAKTSTLFHRLQNTPRPAVHAPLAQARHALEKHLAPFRSGGVQRAADGLHNTWTDLAAAQDLRHKAARWLQAAHALRNSAWDTHDTREAWQTKNSGGSWLRRKGMELLDGPILPWTRKRSAVPFLAENALPWAASDAALGAHERHNHPNGTKASLHRAGDVFRNAVDGMRGDPKAAKGWHRWRDLAASTRETGSDPLSFDVPHAIKNARAQRHAFKKMLGFERPKSAKHPPTTLSKLGSKAFKFLWNDGVALADDGIPQDAAASGWNWLNTQARAPQPHAPAHATRILSHVQAPILRVAHPRKPRATNLPTKTEAEIRVQFDDLPAAASLAARAAKPTFEFETGAQFAF